MKKVVLKNETLKKLNLDDLEKQLEETIKNMMYEILKPYFENTPITEEEKIIKNKKLLETANILLESYQSKRIKKGGRPSTRGRKQKVNRFTKGKKLRKNKGTIKTYRKKNKTRRR